MTQNNNDLMQKVGGGAIRKYSEATLDKKIKEAKKNREYIKIQYCFEDGEEINIIIDEDGVVRDNSMNVLGCLMDLKKRKSRN